MKSKIYHFLEKHRGTGAYFSCIALFIGLICSKFLITLAMIFLVAFGVLSPNLKADFQRFISNKAYWATCGIFLLFFLSAIFSSNSEEAWVRTRIALPLLFLPIAFGMLPSFSAKKYQELLSIFLLSMVLACFGVLVYYLQNYEQMQVFLSQSRAIPTPNDEHIRFSLMINLAIFGGVWLLQEKFYWKWKTERWGMFLGILFLIMMLHLLSVRIGVVIFYVGVIVTAFYYILTKRKYIIGLVLVLASFTLPYLAYLYIPSVQAKVSLTIYNWQLYQSGQIGEYSDTRRMLSYEIAWRIAKQSPWLGVGIGDLEDEQEKIYSIEYPQQPVMYPHNFFLTIYASTGIIGFFFFCFCFFCPLFYRKNYKNLFFLLYYMTIFISFLTENTLLIAIGVALHTFFLLWTLNYLDGQRENFSPTNSLN